ncbi:hypothetical protein [Catenuloplanes indicus]|uniref:Transmembrane protein n=1 Tax=Catenuloplanes indicus TaxID=137267 RepID=A0AAE3W7S5_9ACTN|nr:hypothetical protein [Catenuloplanes indicus]MDQ0370895.1 hypothetical protein [Catenuloplanes indicus]
MSAAAVFVWLGMVIAISFIEAPLKFRAPGVTLPIGLGIGRLVFRALNIAEVTLATAALLTAVITGTTPAALTALAGAVVILTVQISAVRPTLTRRSDRVLAGEPAPRSRAHLIYIALEILKVPTLITAGTLLLP